MDVVVFQMKNRWVLNSQRWREGWTSWSPLSLWCESPPAQEMSWHGTNPSVLKFLVYSDDFQVYKAHPNFCLELLISVCSHLFTIYIWMFYRYIRLAPLFESPTTYHPPLWEIPWTSSQVETSGNQSRLSLLFSPIHPSRYPVCNLSPFQIYGLSSQ